MAVELTIKQALDRETNIQEELERLQGKEKKTPEDRARVGELIEEFREVHEHRLNAEHDAALAEVRDALTEGTNPPAPSGERKGGGDVAPVDTNRRSAEFIAGKYRNPWDTSEMRVGYGDVGGELRSRARDAIEKMPHASDKVREAATQFVQRDGKGSPVAQLVLASTSQRYFDAFAKIIRSNGNVAALTQEEQQIIARAMSLTDSAGGFMVPFQLDPTIILTANGSVNQVRQIARVVQATGDVWHGVSSAGVSGSWDGELEEVSDDAPTLAQPSVPIHKYQTFVPLSHEVAQDAAGLAEEISALIAFDKDTKESISHVTGSGTGQPTGIITALTGGSSVVASATTDTLAVADVYNLDGALPQRYAANGSWLGHRKIYNRIRQLDTAGGNALWGQLAEGRKSELLGRPDYISEAMDDSLTALADNLVLVFGDFKNYVIADRLGTTMSYIPHLFGANGRPNGSAGWHAWSRSGADSVNDAAFRVLNVT